MNAIKYLAKYVSSCIALLVIAGCAALNFSAPDKPVVESAADSVIAQDFVNIMVQIEAIAPSSTILHFGLEEGNASEIDGRSIKTGNVFGKALRAAVANRGYALETVSSPSGGDNYVKFSIMEFGDAVDGTTYIYDVSVGKIDFRRIYKPLDDGGVVPVKSMLVRGVDVAQLETDDSIFTFSDNDKTSTADSPFIKRVPIIKPAAPIAVAKNDQLANSQAIDSASESASTVTTNGAVLNDATQTDVYERPVAIAAPLISDLPKPAFDGSTDASATGSGTVAQSLVDGGLSVGFETIRKINIAVKGGSNYENLLADKKDVAEEVLIFGDDSYVLGARNKQILGEMMGAFNPDTDVVSVVGCSTGITKIVNGNAALAIGRANRVKEALLYSGVPHDQIYDEGCWSPTANSTPFPNRGVVVTVKRVAAKG